MDVILLLTGCIVPNVTDKLYFADPEERQRQYVESLRWYLDHTPFRIIFAENSGTDLSSLFHTTNRIEFLTYKSKPTIPERSRSYKEMEILEYVRDHSKFLNSGGVDIVVKITGRLQLLNIMKLTEYVCHKAKRCNMGFISAYKNAKRADADCKYLWFSPNWLPYLLAQKEHMYADYPFEWGTGDAIRASLKDGFSFIYPSCPPREHGRGSNGGLYDMTAKQYGICNLKHQLKRIFFRIGIFPLR